MCIRDRRGGGNDDAPALHLREADVVFNVAMLHGGGIIPSFHPDEARLLDCSIIIALIDARMRKNVVRIFLMQLRRAGLHCLLGIQHKREFLIFHLDRTQRFCRRDLVFSDDGGNIIPIEANAARQKQPVRHILMVRVRRPRVPCRGEFIFRHIKAGHNFNHSLDFFRRARVDGLHHAVCNRGMQHFSNKRIPVTKVIRIARPAGDLVKRIHALFALSNLSLIHISAPLAEKIIVKMTRDNARTPVQWSGGRNAGFTDGTPWMRVNPNYREINIEEDVLRMDSVVNFYKKAIALHHAHPALTFGTYAPVRCV